MDLSETPDEVFASGALGQGVAIEPAEGKVYAPCDGTVTTFASTCHAIGLTSDTGVEILIHVGMDTVDMNGDGFSPKKKEGDSVKKGELLLEFDMEKIRAAGHPVITPVVITNTDDFAEVAPAVKGDVTYGKSILTIRAH